jgi:hypothetical protein
VTIYTWKRDQIDALYQNPNFETAPINDPKSQGPWTQKSNRDGGKSFSFVGEFSQGFVLIPLSTFQLVE